jgi:nucleotidyltransferase substrate binding protein (TIGR01987 family)
MSLDISSLDNAVQRLREGLARHQREPADEQLRDGLIQRFEFTYELSHRTLKRFLKESAASPDDLEQMAFADLIRTANAQSLLLGDWPAWRAFRQMRARTSHTYNATTTEQMVAAIPGFMQEAEHLAAELRRRLA